MRELGAKYVGQPVPRREDKRLLVGEGRYVADLQLTNMVHVALARSQVPHARIAGVDLAAARAAEGVVLALEGGELRRAIEPISGMQVVTPKGWRDRVEHRFNIPSQPVLAHDNVRYVGEPYALVVAADRYLAEDAAELIEARLDPLPAAVDIDAALARGAALLHHDVEGNVAAFMHLTKGEGGAALAGAPRRLKRRLYHHRYAAMPMECRGVVADYDPRTDTLTIWSSTQVVHWVRREVAQALGMPEERVRCIAPDVGGGFGGKGHTYPEDLIVAYLAKRLKRPVKWVEDRHEHLLNSAHSRDNVYDVEFGFDDSGRILAVKCEFTVDSGAFSPVGAGIAGNSMAHMLGPYDIAHYDMTARIVVTNRTPNAPYRGAGRPEVVFAMERMVDMMARDLGMDPAEVRLRNMVKPEQMPYAVGLPYRDGVPITYDGGDYPGALRRALDELGGLAAFRARQAAAWKQGRYLGLGIGCYVEGTGVGPFEGATVRVDPSGIIAVSTGACSQGQGHETIFAQVAADAFNVPIEDVIVTVSDTAAIPMGYGTIASRSAVTSSNAIVASAEKVKTKALAIAANMLETNETDLEFRDGGVGVKGVPDMKVTLKQLARAARPGWDHRRPPGVEAGLEATDYYEPPTVTWTYAANAAIVEIETDTGRIRIEKYVSVHDAGVLINPMIVEGQVRGGLVQGLGGALLEELAYDAEGQLLTGSLMDYLLPTASDVPPITVVHVETPSTLNALGVKGLGEGGAIAPPVVVANAVADALKPLGVEFNSTPVRWAS